MIVLHFAVLLLAQLAGEVLVRALDVPIPGPVAGMALLTLLLLWRPKLADAIRPTAMAILGFLALLFVPAGVGIVDYDSVVGGDGPALLVAILASTVAAIVVTALTFRWMLRLAPSGEPR